MSDDSTNPRPGEPDPEQFAEQLRRMMEQMGLHMPSQSESEAFLKHLGEMFNAAPGSQGFGFTFPMAGFPTSGVAAPGDDSAPIDWNQLKDVARHVSASKGPDPTPGAEQRQNLLDTTRLAENWLDQHCEFPGVTAAPAPWSRAEWIESTFPAWQRLVEPVLMSLTNALAGVLRPEPGMLDDELLSALASTMTPVLRRIAASLYGSQLAESLATLSTVTTTGTEIGLQVLPGAQVITLPANIGDEWNNLHLDPHDVQLYLVLREAARQRLFNSVTWLGPQLLALIEHYAREIRIDSSAIESAINLDDVQNLTGEKLEQMSQDLQGRLFEPSTTPEQEGVLKRLETLLALIEGWVDDVTGEVARTWLPSHAQLIEVTRRRRATGGPAAQFFDSLLGLSLRPRHVREAGNLWAALRHARGTVGRDAVWHHPDLIPTAENLADPIGYVQADRDVTDSSSSLDGLDAELEQLLRDEGGTH